MASLCLVGPNGAENIPTDGEKGSRGSAEHNDSITRLKQASATNVSAVATKAKSLIRRKINFCASLHVLQ